MLRFERVLPLLDDLDVVVPALPGFPFAAALTEVGMTTTAMAALVAASMEALGYHRYAVSGGDVGADVAEQLTTTYPDRVSALHLDVSALPADPPAGLATSGPVKDDLAAGSRSPPPYRRSNLSGAGRNRSAMLRV